MAASVNKLFHKTKDEWCINSVLKKWFQLHSWVSQNTKLENYNKNYLSFLKQLLLVFIQNSLSFVWFNDNSSRTTDPRTIALHEIPPGQFPPGLLPFGQLPLNNFPLDKYFPDNYPLWNPPGAITPRNFAPQKITSEWFPLGNFPSDNYPWIVPLGNCPQDNYPHEIPA